MKVITKSISNTEKIAKDFIEKISILPAQAGGVYGTACLRRQALVVGLYGDLGSGKTTFTQAVAKIFDVKEYITSPTFVIEKIYPIRTNGSLEPASNGASDINHNDFRKLVHIDAYRLDSAKELLSLDWEKTLSDPRNIIFIEWPERVIEILPKNHAKIFFKFLNEFEREIEI